MIEGHHFLVLGRVGMDLYPEPVGTKIENATSMRPTLGGSSGNIAAGLARLGGKVEMISMLSDDPVGRFVRNELRQYGIGSQFIATSSHSSRTTLAFAESVLEGHEAMLYRNGAADIEINDTLLEVIPLANYSALIVTGTALAEEPSATATLKFLQRAQQEGVRTILDIDYRAPAWKSITSASKAFASACEYCDIIIGNDVEFDVLAGGSGGQDLARKISANRLIVYKMGGEGSWTYHEGDALRHGVFSVQAIKPVGAGDAFMAGFVSALSNKKSISQSVMEGSANAAIVVSRVGCAPAMATRAELDDFLANHHIGE